MREREGECTVKKMGTEVKLDRVETVCVKFLKMCRPCV